MTVTQNVHIGYLACSDPDHDSGREGIRITLQLMYVCVCVFLCVCTLSHTEVQRQGCPLVKGAVKGPEN